MRYSRSLIASSTDFAPLFRISAQFLRRQSHCCVEEAVKLVKGGSCEIKRDELEIGSVVGEGATGIIFEAKWRGKKCAAKMLKHGVRPDTCEYRDLITELSILTRLGSHRNLVTFYGAYIEDLQAPVIIEEFMEGPDLEVFLNTKDAGFDLGKKRVHSWSIDILSALNFLHDRDPIIMHRDLKPSNILLSRDCKVLKLADFGLAKEVPQEERTKTAHASNTGTLRYMAPEVVHHMIDEEGIDAKHGRTAVYTEKADIYSASLIMWYMLTGLKPHVNIQTDRIQRPDTAVSRKRWSEFAFLIERMWGEHPELRPSAGMCLKYLHDTSVPSTTRGCCMLR